MGVFQDFGKALSEAAGQGEEVAKHVFNQLLKHPEVALLGPIGVGIDVAQNIARGRGIFGAPAPHAAPPMPAPAYGPGKLAGLLGAALLQGKTISGTQPYAVTSYLGIASATAIAKNTDIGDMFGSANTPAFTSSDTFPWPFQSYRMRWTYTSNLGIAVTTAAGTLAQVSDPAWIATLHAVFSNATEIARVALNNLGLRTSLIGVTGFVATTAQAFGLEIDTQPGVLWPVYYEKNGSYAMSVRTDHVATAGVAFQISSQLDGWVINDPTLVDADQSQIQATLDTLMRSAGTNTVSLVSSQR